MTTREKTLVFAFPMETSLVADATVTTLSQITVYIPEASPTFTSVFAEVGFQDVITATGGTITEHRVGLRLGAAGYTTITETDDITQSGENMAGVISPFDFTSHFTTNWTGTSMTCDMQVYFDQSTGTTQGMANVTGLLHVTYTYDDDTATNATQIKTVRLPMESLATALPTSATNFGTNQIPQLTSGGVLPEASPTIRDWFIVIEGNEANNNTSTDFTISVNIDGGATTNFMTQEAALRSDRFCRWIYKPSVPDTTAAHNLQLWADVAKANWVTATLHVTYEFDASTTTRVLNSILVPIEIASPLGRQSSADASRFMRSMVISDTGTITMRQSAFRINLNASALGSTVLWRSGAQSYRTYTPALNVSAGMVCLQQRIDSGGAQGAALTLARGSNDFVIDGYHTHASVDPTNLNGLIILNYESDIGSGGVGQNTHTVIKKMLDWDAALTDQTVVSSYSFAVPETDYWLTASGFCFIEWSTASQAVTLDVQALSGEGKGAGYYDIYADALQTDAERACSIIWMRGRDTFKRFPDDAGSERLDIETARNYRLFTSTTSSNGMLALLTYHSHTWEVAGTISGNDAGSTTDIRLVLADTGEVLQEQTLSAGTTAYSFTVYDNTENYYVDAYQDATHAGRSAVGTAS